MAAKIKKGDRVVVLTGKDKGRQGTVLKVLPKEERVLVEDPAQARLDRQRWCQCGCACAHRVHTPTVPLARALVTSNPPVFLVAAPPAEAPRGALTHSKRRRLSG